MNRGLVYFQVVDDKRECIAFYKDGELIYDNIFGDCTRTWSYSSSLSGADVWFADIFVSGASLWDCCPESVKDRFEQITNKFEAFKKSIKISDIDMRDHCIFDLVPEKDICELLECKNIITKSVFNTVNKPDNYDHLLNAVKLVDDIGCDELNIDFRGLKNDYHIEKVRWFLKKMKNSERCVSYNVFGSRTGRLTTKRNSFPILNLDKTLRKYIKPRNDLFVELDFNAAELRTLLALSGKQQPQLDMHDWHSNQINHGGSRDDIKRRVFAWLYNPAARDPLLEGIYNRDWVKDNYWNGTTVRTPFSRKIEADDYHALNYIIQSTSSDICLEQAVMVNKFLKNMKSSIVFLMHDSIVIDYCAKEKSKLIDVLNIFKKTRLGDYVVNLSIGRNFGNMRKVDWTL